MKFSVTQMKVIRNGSNNDNDKLTNNVAASISSRQMNLGNKDIKKVKISIKARQRK